MNKLTKLHSETAAPSSISPSATPPCRSRARPPACSASPRTRHPRTPAAAEWAGQPAKKTHSAG